jgi:hypothetical protein
MYDDDDSKFNPFESINAIIIIIIIIILFQSTDHSRPIPDQNLNF